MKVINTAIIGYTQDTKNIYLPQLLNNNSFNVVKLATINDVNLEEINGLYPNILPVNNYEEILNDLSIDLVVILSSNMNRTDLITKCLNSNKHVLTNKEFSTNHGELSKLFEIANKNNLLFHMSDLELYNSDFLTLKDIIINNNFGLELTFNSRLDNSFNINEIPDSLIRFGSRLILQTITLFGIPTLVFNKTLYHQDTISGFELLLTYENSFTARLSYNSKDNEPLPTFQYVGTRATYSKYGYDTNSNILLSSKDLLNIGKNYYTQNNLQEVSYDIIQGMHYKMFELVSTQILSNNIDHNNQNLMLNTINIIDKAIESSKKQMTIEIKK